MQVRRKRILSLVWSGFLIPFIAQLRAGPQNLYVTGCWDVEPSGAGKLECLLKFYGSEFYGSSLPVLGIVNITLF